MINLLPEENKIKLKKEKYFRVLLFLITYFILFIVLFSATLLVLEDLSRNNLLKEEMHLRATEDSFESIERVELKTSEVNEILQPLTNFYNQQIVVSELAKKSLSLMPENSSLNSFSFNLKDEKGEIRITGHAANYQILLDMENNLKDNYDDVIFNDASWLKINDIDFSVTFKTK